MFTASALLVWLMLGTPAAVAVEESPPAVELEVTTPYGDGSVVDSSDEAVQVEPNEPIELRLHVFEPGRPDRPVSVDDQGSLLRLETADGVILSESFDWKEVRTGIFEASYAFDDPGTFLITVLPTIQDRLSLPEGSTDWVGFEVHAGAVARGESVSSEGGAGLFAIGALVVVVGLAVAAVTRRKPRVHKPPLVHDTWWNSP